MSERAVPKLNSCDKTSVYAPDISISVRANYASFFEEVIGV